VNFRLASRIANTLILLSAFLALSILISASATAQQQPAPTTPPPQAQPSINAAQGAQIPATPQAPAALVIVLDPAHGGTDNGARGATGLVEKDLTLEMARATQSELQRQGLNVILTRDGDENPSFDDRATLANTPRLAIFISFHVSSTGPAGVARAYFDHFSTLDSSSPATPSSSAASIPATAKSRPPDWHPGRTLVPWSEAQRNYVDASQRLGDFIQASLAQGFRGSPDKAGSFAIRDLRSVAAPAVAVEISSVSALDRAGVERLAGPLAASIARGIQLFRPAYERQHP